MKCCRGRLSQNMLQKWRLRYATWKLLVYPEAHIYSQGRKSRGLRRAWSKVVWKGGALRLQAIVRLPEP